MKTFEALGINLDTNIPGSKYFKFYEALWLPSVQAFALPNEFQLKNIERQAKALDRVREHFNAPIIVTSWLRPEKYNAMIGGATKSKHLYGLATDFVIKGVSCEHVKAELLGNTKIYPGRGEIDTTDWVHLDLTPGPWFYARTHIESS